MPGIPGMPPPLAICIIILRASKNRSTSVLTSETVRPEPLAMRSRREPSMILGFVPLGRGHRLDDRLDPVDLALVEVLELVADTAPIPGSIPMIFDIEPSLRICCICCEEVVEGEVAACR